MHHPGAWKPVVFLILVLLVTLHILPLYNPLAFHVYGETGDERSSWAVYVGYLPPFIREKRGTYYAYYSSETPPHIIGPLLVEWCSLGSYGGLEPVLVHTWYREVVPIRVGEGPSGGGAVEAVSVAMKEPSSVTGMYRLREVDKKFIVVVDTGKGVIVDSKGEPIASWLYILPPSLYNVTVNATSGAGEVFYPLLLPGYVVLGEEHPLSGFSYRVHRDAYIFLPPREEVLGPGVYARVSWTASLGGIVNGSVPVAKGLLDYYKFLAKHIAIGSPEKMWVTFFHGVYDFSSGLLLAYTAPVDPLLLLAANGNASSVFIEDAVVAYGDAAIMNKTIRGKLTKDYGPLAWRLSQNLVYLYNASFPGYEPRVAEELQMPRLVREFAEYAASKSVILSQGCSRGLALKAELLGGWTWDELDKLGRPASTATSIETTITQGGGRAGSIPALPVAAILAAVAVVAVAAYAWRRGR